MKSITSTNPSKGYGDIGSIVMSSALDVQTAVIQAREVLVEWKNIGIPGRINAMESLMNVIKEKKEELSFAVSTEMGMPIVNAREDVDIGLQYLLWYTQNVTQSIETIQTCEDDNSVSTLSFEPIGVVGVIAPWNFPVSNFVWQAGQNLLVGNTVVFKFSEEVVLFGQLLASLIASSDIPSGVFTVIYGDGSVGESLLAQDIDLVCFTGSSTTGAHVAQLAASRHIPCVLELGGSAAGIICADADIDAILETLYIAKFLNAGQICDGLKRLLVHESRFDELVEKLSGLLAQKKIGIATEDDTDMGPLVAKRQLEKLEVQIKDAIDKGAVAHGNVQDITNLDGAYAHPIILTQVTKDMQVWNEEVFGPVLPVMKYASEEEAIALANDTDLKLGGYIFTQDKATFERLAAKLQTGMVAHNNATYLHPANPFGGMGASGFGRSHGVIGFQELCHKKVVTIEKST